MCLALSPSERPAQQRFTACAHPGLSDLSDEDSQNQPQPMEIDTTSTPGCLENLPGASSHPRVVTANPQSMTPAGELRPELEAVNKRAANIPTESTQSVVNGTTDWRPEVRFLLLNRGFLGANRYLTHIDNMDIGLIELSKTV